MAGPATEESPSATELSAEAAGAAARSASRASARTRRTIVMSARTHGRVRTCLTNMLVRGTVPRSMRGGIVAALLAAALAAAPAGAAELVSTQQLGPRLQELTLRTSALAAETHVRVLLPTGYDPARRYPV